MTDATDRAREALETLPPGGWLNEIAAPQLVRDLLAENDALRAELEDANLHAKSGWKLAAHWQNRYAERADYEARAARVQGMREAAEIARSVALAAGREAERYATQELVAIGWTDVAKGASDAASSIISAAAALEKGQADD